MSSESRINRYNSVAIILHWVMAIGFLMMLASGVAIAYVELAQSLKFQMYQWHKSGGVVLLIGFGLRVLWRFVSMVRGDIPALPSGFSRFEALAAHFGHWGLYALMLVMPLSGWLMVSASVYGLPTIVFGWFEWPHIPGVQGREDLHELGKVLHFYLAIGLAAMIALHVGAVVKHYVFDGENVLRRMWWSKS